LAASYQLHQRSPRALSPRIVVQAANDTSIGRFQTIAPREIGIRLKWLPREPNLTTRRIRDLWWLR
jgi:hypothetical protein